MRRTVKLISVFVFVLLRGRVDWKTVCNELNDNNRIFESHCSCVVENLTEAIYCFFFA